MSRHLYEHAAKREPAPSPSRYVIDRGRYLTDLGDCAACHTRPGGPPFAGGRAIRTPYGIVHSTNITPDQSGIGGWTAAQFYCALREGRDAEGRELFPAFPYYYYTNVSSGCPPRE